MLNFGDKKLILSSNSPRRRELLQLADIPFIVKCKDSEESFPEDMRASEVAEYIAVKKSAPWQGMIQENEIVLTADSIVILEEKILGKPRDKKAAFEMLESLSGNIHKVITGCCLTDSQHRTSFSESTEVQFYPISKEEIEYYIDNYKPFDKAGAYGIQEWIGLSLIKEIRGSWSNVVGLPVHRVYDELKGFL